MRGQARRGAADGGKLDQTGLDWTDITGNFGSPFGTDAVFRSRIPEGWKRDFPNGLPARPGKPACGNSGREKKVPPVRLSTDGGLTMTFEVAVQCLPGQPLSLPLETPSECPQSEVGWDFQETQSRLVEIVHEVPAWQAIWCCDPCPGHCALGPGTWDLIPEPGQLSCCPGPCPWTANAALSRPNFIIEFHHRHNPCCRCRIQAQCIGRVWAPLPRVTPAATPAEMAFRGKRRG